MRPSAERRYAVKADLPDPSARLGELRSEMEALGDEYLAGLDFMDFGAKNFRLSLKDDPEYMDRVLSGRQTDTLDMWSRTTNALDQVVRFTYDESDNPVSVVDRLGRRTEYVLFVTVSVDDVGSELT